MFYRKIKKLDGARQSIWEKSAKSKKDNFMKRLDEPFTVLPQKSKVANPQQQPALTASADIEDHHPTPATASATSDSTPLVSFDYRVLSS